MPTHAPDHSHPPRPPGEPYHAHLPDYGVLIVVPGMVLPGLNEMLRMGPWKYKRAKELWYYLVMSALGRHRPRYERARIATTVYRLGRMDEDNKQASFKIMGDVLRDLQVIPDDKPKYIKTHIENVHLPRKQRGEVRTEVRIERWNIGEAESEEEGPGVPPEEHGSRVHVPQE